ncbi:MAG: PEPxxWA-CTERM sorting domain-containing protein [Caulobacterales bacterium]|nr:PEPxxWA-CTERM sorting domain-containing protein [Caulobacterales bacterium]
MRKLLLCAGVVFALAAGSASARTVADPTGDFLPSFVPLVPGVFDPDLDVTSLSVAYDKVANAFLIGATFAGNVDPSKPGLYVLGIDTGLGAIHPFGGIGEPDVRFDQVAVIQKNGLATLSGHTLTATVSGDSLMLLIPNQFLIPTGSKPGPQHYGFNLWPRNGLGNNNQIADFAPQNAVFAAAPEPASWALMLAGFGGLGAALRRRRAMAAAMA